MARNGSISVAQIKDALQKNAGIISAAANALGCTPSNIRQRINADSELLAFHADLEEQVLDLAEGVVRKALRKGDATTARWLLDRKARKRGYGNTTELFGPKGVPIPVATSHAATDPVTPEEIAAARRRFIVGGDD